MGNVDLFHSRRDNFLRCEYWIRDERSASGTPAQWVLYKQSNGVFYAKPLTVKSNRMQVINGVWALDDNNITLETDDDVREIKRGCIVKFDEMLWLVTDVQYSIHTKETEFNKKIIYKYIVSLTRG